MVTGSQTQDLTYDPANNVLRQEPAGSMDYQTFEYDSLSRRTSETDPLGHSRLFAYDAASNMTSMTDQNNQVWTRGNDALGRLVRSANPLGESTTYGYNSAGEQTTVANALGETTTSTFDDAARLTAVSDPLSKVTSYAYDANGNQTSVTDPNNLTTVSEYDYRDRLVKVTDPAGHATQYAYNRAGERLVETDAKSQSTTHTYDALGRRVSTTDRLNQTTTFSWNVLGLQESITDAESQTTSYVYDDYGRRYQTIWPDHVAGSVPGDAGYGITQTEYDALNRVLRTTDQLGDTVTHGYDAAGRLLSRDYRTKANSPGGTIADSDTLTYDASSRMLSAQSGRYSNNVAYTYDAAGRKSTESLTISGQTYTSTNQYDAAGRVSKLIYPDASQVSRTYTARGQLHTLVAGLTTVDTRAYDDGGRLASSSYNNGVSEARTYNMDNTLASISFTGAPVGDYSYGWDANQSKTSESITGTMSGYGFTVGASGYDAEDRLVNWQRSDTNLDQAWNLSPVGDWNSITENASTQNRTHGAAHELLSAASQSVQHDPKGNMTLIPAVLRSGSNPLAMKWDFENKLRAADANGDGVDDVFYKWDALGRRVGRDDGTTNTVYFQDGQQTLADYGAGAVAGSPTYKYVYGSYIDEPVLRVDSSGDELYYHRNQQYSIVALTDGVGAISERYTYTAYGEPTILDGSGSPQSFATHQNRYQYTGREWDEKLELYHYRARMYDPVAGRFLGRDPIHVRGGINLYEYVRSIPLSLLDPTGNSPEYCGPDATSLLAEELRYASNFWAQHMRYWSDGFLRMRAYLSWVRWRHMLQIGPQLDWTNLYSEPFRDECGLLIDCPTKKCKNTYRICGECVHDHFIGNIMFGYWTSLHGIHWMAGDFAGHVAQVLGETDDRGFDKPWDQAGYNLGRILAAFDRGGTPLNDNTVCQILKGSHGDAFGYFTMANQRYSDDYSHCNECPKGLSGGVRRWAKRFNGGYPAF